MAKRKSPRRLEAPLEMFAGSRWASLQLQAAFDAAVRKYAGRPSVTGIDLGYKWVKGKRTKTIAVRIHVDEKHELRALTAREKLPKSINGVPVDVIEAIYTNCQGGALQTRVGRLRPGVSVGRVADGAGTLGMFVVDERAPGGVAILSAAHVLFAAAGGPGDSIVQPGLDDGGVAADEVATLTRAFRQSDAAVARLSGARPRDRRVAVSDVTLTAPRKPQLGETLEKCGRSTGITRAEVDGLGHHMGLRDTFRLVGATPAPIVDFGDSGAVWYDPVTGAAVGLHCKGPILFTPSANFAIATQLSVVMPKLAVHVE